MRGWGWEWEPLAGRMALFAFVPVVDQDGVDQDGFEARQRGGSCEIARLQRGVSLIDDLELLLGRLVAAMGIGMMQFDQNLIPRLEAHQGEGGLDFENGERLLARRQRTPHRIPPVVAMTPAFSGSLRTAGENAKRVADPLGVTGAVTVT